MTKIYTKNTWTDEILASLEKYIIRDDAGNVVYNQAQIELATAVVAAGTALSAARMNNIENGIDGLDTLLNILLTAGAEKIKETSGPTTLTVGNIANGKGLKREGNSIVGVDIGGTGFPCDLRMSLSSASAVTTTDIASGSMLYIHTFNGNNISLRDVSTSGSPYTGYTHSGSSIAIPSTSGSMYDVFSFVSSGSVAFETALTTRTNNLPRDEYGILTKSGDVSKRYIGSFRTSSTSGKCDDSLAKRLLWNYYNRIPKNICLISSTSHTYSTAAWRPFNGDSTIRIEFLVGMSDIFMTINFSGDTTTASGGNAYLGIGINTTNDTSIGAANNMLSAQRLTTAAFNTISPNVGYTYMVPVEYSGGNTTYHNTIVLLSMQC